MGILTDPKTPVFSLDMETTSLNKKDSKIWSIAVSGDKNYAREFFQKGVINQSSRPDQVVERLHAAHVKGGAGSFSENQVKSNAFDPYQKAFESKSLKSIDDSIKTITQDLKGKSGVFLVQNMKFDSQQLGSAKDKVGPQKLSKEVRSNFLEGLFGLNPEHYENSSELIPLDKRILEARKEFDSAADLYKRSAKFSQETVNKFGSRLTESTDNLERMMNIVLAEGKKNQVLTPIDLMDVTKIYTSRLAQKEAIAPAYTSSGLTVDYLARNLLNDSEKHTALMDTKQQRLGYKILSRRMDKINKTEELSKKDLKYGKDLMGSDIHDKTFISGLNNRLDELVNTKGNVSDSDLDELIRTNIARSDMIPEKENFSRAAFAEDIKKTFLRDPSEAFSKLNAAKSLDAPLPDTSSLPVPDESPILRKGGMSKNSKILLGLTALGVVSMVGSNNRQSKKEDLTSYDDLYENVYLGQEYANWQERNNSHKMIY